METPTININGRNIEPAPPTMKVWRGTVDFLGIDKTQWSVDDLGKRYAAYIVTAFNRPEVTAESLEENLLASDLIDVGNKLLNWVYLQMLPGLEQLPNESAPTQGS